MCTKGFFNYFSAIIECLKGVFKGEIIKFSKNCGTFAIKESGGVKVQFMPKCEILTVSEFDEIRHVS